MISDGPGRNRTLPRRRPRTPERTGAISAAGAGSVDASAYNELVRENLDLRRKLTDTSAGESRLAGENQRLTTEVKSLEGQIGKLAASLQELKQKEPSGAPQAGEGELGIARGFGAA